MTIITLTTDMGDRDYYVGTVKGALLCVNPALNVVDITHRIKPYNIVEASFVLGNSYRNFPEGSIHIISVNDFYQKERQLVVYNLRSLQERALNLPLPSEGEYQMRIEKDRLYVLFDLLQTISFH